MGKLNASLTKRFTNLKWLSLYNSSLSEFDFDMIKHHREPKDLDISYNNSKHLHNVPLLKTFESLSNFRLVNNQFDNMAEVIENLPLSVRDLDLSGNFVGKSNATAFGKLKNLNRLALSNTSLEISDSNPFEKLENFAVFRISNNNLKNIDLTVLSLSHLHRFYAVHCQLENVLQLIQHFGTSLEKLDAITLNYVGNLSAETLQNLTNSKHIVLNSVSLSHLNVDTFKYQSKLRFVDVSYNDLREIDAQLLPESLVTLNVMGNDLREIRHFNRQ